jgi:hypothetical protein
MNCYYTYQPIGGYVKISVFKTLENLKTKILTDEDIDTLVYDYDYRTIAASLLTHAFAGNSALAEACAEDFVRDAPVDTDTISLHQIADWYANWKKTH